MQPKFNPPHGEYNSELLCPSCESNYLHHGRVEIFEREEDEDNGVHVLVEKGKATVDTCLVGNPSQNRHGLKIHFSCEECASKSVLTLAQHKGNTSVYFKKANEA